MKVINYDGFLMNTEDSLNKGLLITDNLQSKFKASVASIDFNFYDDESIERLWELLKKESLKLAPKNYVIRQKSTFSRLKPLLDTTQLKNVHTHQIIFFEYGFEDVELHPLHIIPEDGFLKIRLYPKNNYQHIKLSSRNQNKYQQEQAGNLVESWEDLFEKVSLAELIDYNKSHYLQNYQHLLDNINLTVSVSLGEGNDFDGKAGLVLTYEDILNTQPNIKIETKYDVMRYQILKESQDYIKQNIYDLPNDESLNTFEEALYWYTPELSTVFSGSNGGGFFDPYYSGINTLCCTLLNSKLTNTSYNILTGDIPAAFMLYFPVTNLNEGKYEGYYQGQREIPIPKGEFI